MSFLLQGAVPVQDLYARALLSAWKHPQRILDPAFAEQRDPQAWRKIRRDTKVAQAIELRTVAVAGQNWTVLPASDRPADKALANVVEDALRQSRRFHAARKRLAQAIFLGRAYEYIEGARRIEQLGAIEATEWWLPTSYRHMGKSRFQVVPDHSPDTVGGHWQVWSDRAEDWIDLEPCDRASLIEVIYDDEEEHLGYGRGILDSLYFMWWVKQNVLKEGLQGLERWAQGFLLGTVGTSRGGGAGKDLDTRRALLQDRLEKHRARHVAVVDEGDKVEIVAGGGEGYQMVQGFLSYCDAAIMALAMGSVLPFGQGEDVGSLARANVESDISDTVIQSDREELDEAITEKLVGQFVRLNQRPLAAAGLAGARRPRFETIQQKTEDPQRNATVISTALAAGIALRRDEVYQKIGFTPPTDDDEVFEGRPGGGLPPELAGLATGQGRRAF